jgi:hypothetical protein
MLLMFFVLIILLMFVVMVFLVVVIDTVIVVTGIIVVAVIGSASTVIWPVSVVTFRYRNRAHRGNILAMAHRHSREQRECIPSSAS